MEPMKQSVSFDRAADIYDATRALSEDAQRGIADGIIAEIERVGADRVLEVGVGTGRIARPLAEHGVRVLGVDIAPKMLQRLVAQLDERHLAPDLMLGDATRLPVADGAAGVVLSFHVLHLIPDWELACDEVRRVLAPGGTFVHYQRRDEYHKWIESGEKWVELLKARGFVRRQRPSLDEIGAKLEALGGSLRTVDVGAEEERVTPSEMLADTKERTHSWTWEIPDEVFWDCMAEYEEWVGSFYDDVDEARVDSIVHELRFWSFD